MAVEESVKNRIIDLINQAKPLSMCDDSGQAYSMDQVHDCAGWVVAALNVVQLIIPDPNSAYRKRAEEIASRQFNYDIAFYVGEFSSLLKKLLEDIQLGLLASVENRAKAEAFDDFLDHAKEYLKDGKKQESGVIAGVVFEDSLRRICRKHGIEDQGEKLDYLISKLVNKGIISQTKAKRARAAAHVRTKATHAQWDEFDLNDVNITINFAEEMITSMLDI